MVLDKIRVTCTDGECMSASPHGFGAATCLLTYLILVVKSVPWRPKSAVQWPLARKVQHQILVWTMYTYILKILVPADLSIYVLVTSIEALCERLAFKNCKISSSLPFRFLSQCLSRLPAKAAAASLIESLNQHAVFAFKGAYSNSLAKMLTHWVRSPSCLAQRMELSQRKSKD